MHIDLGYALYLIYLCCANGVVNKNGHVMDDMLLYHAQKNFAWSLVSEGTNAYLRMSLHEWLKTPHF
jgi:glycine cleavage system aminomethyltransferase T